MLQPRAQQALPDGRPLRLGRAQRRPGAAAMPVVTFDESVKGDLAFLGTVPAESEE